MCSIKVIIEHLSNIGKMSMDEEKVSELLSRYRAIFSVSDHQISHHPTNPLYWSQLLLLCSNITPADGLGHVPLSPVQLSITLTKDKVVLRGLQGMALPTSNEKIFNVMLRFSASFDGLVIAMHDSKMKVPPKGKVIPLTLVIQTANKRGVMVFPSLGTWKQFNVNWPKEDMSCQVLNSTDDDDDLELLLNTGPILSSAGDAIVPLEEENT